MQIKCKKGYIAIYSKNFVRFMGFLFGIKKEARGAALFPFIFFSSEEYEIPFVVNHERIHFRQQLELLFVFSFLISILEKFYAKFFLKKSKMNSYLYCAAEQEAYLNQLDFNYLKNRKPFAIFKYLFNKKNFDIMKDKSGKIIIR